MKDKKHFRSLIADVRALLADARADAARFDLASFDQARATLAGLAADPEISALGPATILGLPRPLHSAMLSLAKAEGDILRTIAYQYTLVPPPALLARHGQFTTAERSRMAVAHRAAVPRTIHQIWIGRKPPPVTTLAWQAHAARHGYDYRLWRESDLARIGADRHPAFVAMVARGDMPGAVDVARYVILQQLGGIYLDCDWYPARDDIGFHDRLALTGLTVIAEATPRNTGAGSVLLSNAFIAAPAGHPVFDRILAVLPDVLREMPEAPAWWSTGPLLFTVICRGTTVAITDSALIAGAAADTATSADIAALCAEAVHADGGLLLAWKPW